MKIINIDHDPVRRDIQRGMKKRERLQERWNDPTTQSVEETRRQMYADAERSGKIQGLKNEVNDRKSKLDKLDKARMVLESELRTYMAQLAELTGFDAPAAVEPKAEPVEVDNAPRGRGRPPKGSA